MRLLGLILSSLGLSAVKPAPELEAARELRSIGTGWIGLAQFNGDPDIFVFRYTEHELPDINVDWVKEDRRYDILKKWFGNPKSDESR